MKGKTRRKRRQNKRKIMFLIVAVTVLGLLLIGIAIYGTAFGSKENATKSPEELQVEDMTHIPKQEMDSLVSEPQAEIEFKGTHNNVDYSEYFQGISGCAVLYDESSNTYFYYNKENCETEVSPLSTFKIISTLAGLENNVLENEETTMEYSGTKYPIAIWNSNLTLEEAFENSCVWYFRKVVDTVGQENIQLMLTELQYGNRDISEWNGGNVNSLPELNGFWLESSLKISPLQQVNVLKYIFSGENNFSPESIETLKHIMYLSEFENGSLYGKTGTGPNGEAWFIGFIEKNGNKTYFAVYLEDTQNKDIVSGNKAKEIAVSILDILCFVCDRRH